jgi:hypothetical protein
MDGRVNNTVDDVTLLALQSAGKTTRQIESLVQTMSRSTIAKRLKHLSPRKSTDIFRELKADILAEKQRQLLNIKDNPKTKCKLDPADHKNIAIAFGVYEEREARLRGQLPEGRPMVIINKMVVNQGKVEGTAIDVVPIVDISVRDTRSTVVDMDNVNGCNELQK